MIQPMFMNLDRSRHSRRSILWVLAVCFLLLAIVGPGPTAQAAKPTKTSKPSAGSNPYDVLNLVNQLRAANGLAPLQANVALMAAAQAHSEYQASVHSITHYGPGGNSPKDRAAAAGYGGGATFFLSENIYGGTNASAQQAITWWQGDAPHLNTMLGANYQDAGAGVATDGSLVYYTLDVGYVSGSTGTGGTGGSTPRVGTVTPITFNPVQIATPMPDGSIVHTVQSGQTLWTIAAIYKIDLQELLKLNHFNEGTFIYPGQKVLIKGPDALPTPTASQTAIPTSTRKPTPIPRRTATEVGLAPLTLDSASLPASQPAAPTGISPVLMLIGALVMGGVVLLGVGTLLSGRGAAK
jgi:uncharacterized protein YkwD